MRKTMPRVDTVKTQDHEPTDSMNAHTAISSDSTPDPAADRFRRFDALTRTLFSVAVFAAAFLAPRPHGESAR
jgi:hypothetical protein